MSQTPPRQRRRWRIVWIALLSLAVVLVAVTVFGILFLKRAVVDYRSEHDFPTRDPSFFASAHALADPLPLEGNAVLLLHNGDEIFPAMLAAIRGAGRDAYGELLEGGVKFFEFAPSMIHTKSIVVDGLFSVLGSSNFDARSAQFNEELDITIYDEGFGAEMDTVFQSDLQQAKPYRLEDFKKRPATERFSEWLVAPLAPLL